MAANTLSTGRTPVSSPRWLEHRETIKQLWLTDGLRLAQLRQVMYEDYGFSATIRQYKAKFKAWNMRRNMKRGEKEFMVQKKVFRQRQGKPTAFKLCGRPVGDAVLVQAEKAMLARGVPIQHPIGTPEGVTYSTPPRTISGPIPVQMVLPSASDRDKEIPTEEDDDQEGGEQEDEGEDDEEEDEAEEEEDDDDDEDEDDDDDVDEEEEEQEEQEEQEEVAEDEEEEEGEHEEDEADEKESNLHHVGHNAQLVSAVMHNGTVMPDTSIWVSPFAHGTQLVLSQSAGQSIDGLNYDPPDFHNGVADYWAAQTGYFW